MELRSCGLDRIRATCAWTLSVVRVSGLTKDNPSAVPGGGIRRNGSSIAARRSRNQSRARSCRKRRRLRLIKCSPELVAGLGAVVDVGAVLMPELTTGGPQARREVGVVAV